jgi:hypothetical protein
LIVGMVALRRLFAHNPNYAAPPDGWTHPVDMPFLFSEG